MLSESGYCVNYVYKFSSPDVTSVKGGNLSQVAGQAIVVVKESIPQAPLKKTMQIVSSTRASSSKRQRVDGSSDGDVEAPPPYKESHPGNF